MDSNFINIVHYNTFILYQDELCEEAPHEGVPRPVGVY